MARAGAVWLDVLPNMALFGRTVAAESKLSLTGIGTKTGQEYGTALARAAKGGLRGLGASVGAELKVASAQAASAVEEASGKIAVARDREAKAAGAVRVAELKLQELRASGKASASTLAAAEERLATAERGVSVAARGTATATKEMALAQERSAVVAKAVAEQNRLAGLSVGAFAARGKAGLDRLGSSIGNTLKSGAKLGGLFAGFEVAKFVGGSLKAAGDFQQGTNVLVTAAGETTSNLALVRKGILDIAANTGNDWKGLTDGLYQIEKAGYRGADGLRILKAAAQGAREEGAQLDTVANAMTSVMASYHLKASDSVSVMNAMKTAAGSAKTTMELFSGSLSTVLPLASANKISFGDIAGSLASLTQHGTSADQAAQELAFTMRGLAAPNMVAIKEMQNLGLNSQDVAAKLGDGKGGRGLAGTLNYLSQTVLKRMGPSGKVLLNVFNTSKAAAVDATTMMAGMEPATRKVAMAYANGSINMKQWGKALIGMAPQQASLARQFGTVENRAKGFNQAIRAGMPGSQMYSEAIKKMAGGAAGLNTVLQLTGESTAGTNTRIAAISKSMKDGGKDVEGWASTQQLFNVKMDAFKEKITTTGIQLGTKLLPGLTTLAGKLEDGATAVVDFGSKSSKWLLPLGGVILGLVAAYKVYSTTVKVVTAVTEMFNLTLDANPIGLVVMGLAALVVGLVYAYNHFTTFHNIVNNVFSWIKAHWPLLLSIITGPIGLAVVMIATHFDAVKSIARTALAYVVGQFLSMAGNVIHTAASAFGWVPKLGDKLKSAAKQFDVFAANVNASLAGINGNTVTVGVKFATYDKVPGTDSGDVIGHGTRHAATGGAIYGPGTGTSDSIPAMLSNGEHVITAKEVKAAGGHGAITAWRKSLVQRFAVGGPVIATSTPTAAQVSSRVDTGFGQFTRDQSAALIASGLGNTPGTGVQRWASVIARALSMNGVAPTAARVAAWLRQVATESGGNPSIMQQVHDVNSGPNAARGLLQVIPTTFAANAFPGHGNILNGLDNALAAIRYELGRYGLSSMLNVIGRGHGYASGTNNAAPGYHWVGEKGPELVRFRGGEKVLTHSQSVATTAEMHTKAYLQLGEFIGKSLAAGLQGTQAKVVSTTKTLVNDLAKVYTARVKTNDGSVIKALQDDVRRLVPLVKAHKASAKELAKARQELADATYHKGSATDLGYAAAVAVMNRESGLTAMASRLASARASVAVKLQAAQTKLADALKVRNDYAASVASAASGLGDVVKNSTVASSFHGGADIVVSMQSKLASLKAFTADLAKLKKLGLNKGAYQQIVDAGVDGGGLDAATGLLSGGSKVVKQVNTLQGQINAQGKSLGDTSSRVLYQAGVDSATGLVKGLESQSRALAAASKRVAAQIVSAIKHALGIHSPSRVMSGEVGRFIPLGIVHGIDSQRPALDKSMRSLVQVPSLANFHSGSRSFTNGQSVTSRRDAQAPGARGGLTIHGDVHTASMDEFVAKQREFEARKAALDLFRKV
jgi:SLT domain-containing protein